MITGFLSQNLEPLVRIVVSGPRSDSQEIEALVDTGFNGFLTLPPSLIASLGLEWLYRDEGELADGSTEVFDVYRLTVLWDGKVKQAEADLADAQPLLGMALMQGKELHIQVRDGGRVAIADPL